MIEIKTYYKALLPHISALSIIMACISSVFSDVVCLWDTLILSKAKLCNICCNILFCFDSSKSLHIQDLLSLRWLGKATEFFFVIFKLDFISTSSDHWTRAGTLYDFNGALHFDWAFRLAGWRGSRRNWQYETEVLVQKQKDNENVH